MITRIITIVYFFHIADITPARPISELFPQTKNRPFIKSFGYLEDTYLNFTELTTKYNYASERHAVITEDGYILTIFRILTKCPQAQRFPVILGHGINDSSDTWILTGPETALGYILAANCYDVWAINYRGNVYSRKHVRLDPDKDASFWKYSFEENGVYDLPPTIDYVLHVTGQSKVYYVSHSLGSTGFFVMSSLRPGYNEKIRLSIHLAPIAWMKNVRSPIPKLLSRDTNGIRAALNFVGINEIFGKHQILHALAQFMCQIAPNEVCGTALTLTTGYRSKSITSKNLSVAIGHLLVGISVRTLAHLGQMIMAGEFQRYDEGKAKNIRKYGSAKPSKYDVSLITSPTVLISARNDWISTIEDVDILSSKLPNLVENYVVPESTWSHSNHVWGVNATELVYKKIIQYFQFFNT